jgi:predicted component of type VI protein secretion system
MRSLLRSFLALFTLGAAMTGCKSDAPPAPTDVTLSVPGMN